MDVPVSITGAVAEPVRPRPLRMLWITAAWGACFVAIEWGLRDAPLLWFAALRALIAGAALLALGAALHRPVPRGWRAWGLITVLGLVNVTVAFAAMFGGVAGGATGTAAVLANAQPLLILLPAWWLYGERLSPRTSAALVVGFAGLVVVALPGGGGGGAGLSLLSAAAVTAGTLLSRRLTGLDLVTAAAWHLLMGAAGLMVFAAAVEGSPVIAWTPRFVLSLAFLALVGTAATTVAWFAEARRSQARHVDGVDVPDSGPWYRVGLRRIGRVAGRMDRRRAPRRVGGHVDHPSTTAPGPHTPDGCRPRRLVSHTAGHMNNE